MAKSRLYVIDWAAVSTLLGDRQMLPEDLGLDDRTLAKVQGEQGVMSVVRSKIAKALGVPVKKVPRRPYEVPAEGTRDPAPAATTARVVPPSPAPVDRPPVSVSLGMELRRAGRLVDAVAVFRQLADAGDVVALTHLGWCHQKGLGTPVDLEAAARCYRTAADRGHADAQCNLATLYHRGIGVGKDYAMALRLLREAATRGSAAAMNELGWMYQNGLGVDRDYAEAFRWYKAAADAGNASGLNNVGWMYHHGLGVEPNPQEAIAYYTRAVERGNDGARGNLNDLLRATEGGD